MQYSYEIFPEKRLVVLRYGGHVTVSDIRRKTEELWSDRRYSPAYKTLADLSTASLAGISLSEAKQYGRFVADSPQASVAQVAAVLATPMATALGMIFQGITQPRTPVKLFSTWEGACAFLGVDLDLPPLPKS